MNKVKYTELSTIYTMPGARLGTHDFLPRIWAVFTAPCGRRVRVSCVNIYLECTRTQSADYLIKCGTWRNLLCTLHCTWDALKVLNERRVNASFRAVDIPLWPEERERERTRELTSFAIDHPPPLTMCWLICWALSCNSRQGHLSLNDVMRLALTQVTHMGAITHTPRCLCLCLCFCAFAFTFTFGLLWVLRQPVQHIKRRFCFETLNAHLLSE